MSDPERAQPRLMPGIQVLRLAAAFGIVAHHLIAHFDWNHLIPPGYLEPSRVAAGGVIVFFVLSGFLMAMISEQATPGRFLLQRALRLYPGFWLAVALTFLVKLALFHEIPHYRWFPVLTLTPGGDLAFPLNVEWTLIFEVFFYLVVGVLCFIPSVRIRQLLVLSWAGAILLLDVNTTQPTWQTLPWSSINLPFIFGMVAYWLKDHVPIRGTLAMLAAVASFWAARAYVTPWRLDFCIESVASAVMVLVASRATLFAPNGFWKRLGDASYGLYLIHVPVITILIVATGRSGWVFFFATGAAALVMGIAYGGLEYVLHARLAKLLVARRAVVPRLVAHPVALGTGTAERPSAASRA